MARLLITGSRGQLGAALLARPGRDARTGLDLPDIDIADAASVQTALDAAQPDCLVNCAAWTAVDAAETQPEACARVNTEGPRVLARACAERGVHLIHLSTDYVFNGDRPVPQPWRETDATDPRTVYGRTKRDGEAALVAAGGRFTILRTAWLYGAHGKNFLKTMLRLALADPHREIRVVNDQYGCPTCAEDLARQIETLADLAEPPTGVFHAVSDGHATWHAFASAFLQRMRVPHTLAPCTTAEYPTPARRPMNSILQNEALNTRGLCVMPDWQDALAGYVERHREALIAECRPA